MESLALEEPFQAWPIALKGQQDMTNLIQGFGCEWCKSPVQQPGAFYNPACTGAWEGVFLKGLTDECT